MDSKTKTTIEGVKELGSELGAWEVRVISLKNEAENLRKLNDIKKKEIESSLALAQQEYDKKRNVTKAEEAAIAEEKAKLEAQRTEIQGLVTALKKERNEFEREKQKILDTQADTARLREKANYFLRLVKDEATKL
jgi:hypothetical protein